MYTLSTFKRFESNTMSKLNLFFFFLKHTRLHILFSLVTFKYIKKIKFPPQLLPFKFPFRIQRNAE